MLDGVVESDPELQDSTRGTEFQIHHAEHKSPAHLELDTALENKNHNNNNITKTREANKNKRRSGLAVWQQDRHPPYHRFPSVIYYLLSLRNCLVLR
jgi:hypothetical protein